MEKLKSRALYAYFGELGLFDGDIPGHTFYQLGLLDEISQEHEVDGFEFFNYIDGDDRIKDSRPIFPSDKIGEVFDKYCNSLVFDYRIQFSKVVNRIQNKWYSKLFLKARFRNLSTLQKKLMDAARFEILIQTALKAGYSPSDIIILDTDLSLSEEFRTKAADLGLTIEIPSVTMRACSRRFLEDCLAVHVSESWKRPDHLTYYGNLSFENYKTGHSKDPIIRDIIDSVESAEKFNGDKFTLTVAAKVTQELEEWIAPKMHVVISPRQERSEIWNSLLHSLVSINVSKNLYLERGFTPARVYESLMLGAIPVSYKDSRLHPAMSFETVDQFFEICKFLSECSADDYNKLLTQMIANANK
jgi:hypothetical protein